MCLLYLLISAYRTFFIFFIINRCMFNLFSLVTGSHVFTIIATDADGDTLTYGIEGPDSYYFSCKPSTGEVTLAISVDYEVGGMSKEYPFKKRKLVLL